MHRSILHLLLAVTAAALLAGCGEEAHTASARPAEAGVAASEEVAVAAAITLPRDLFTTSAGEQLVGSRAEFMLAPIQRVFSPELFAVGANGSDLVLVHGRSTAAAPRVGSMAKVAGTVQPISKLPQAQSIAGSGTEFQLSRVYVEADELQIL